MCDTGAYINTGCEGIGDGLVVLRRARRNSYPYSGELKKISCDGWPSQSKLTVHVHTIALLLVYVLPIILLKIGSDLIHGL